MTRSKLTLALALAGAITLAGCTNSNDPGQRALGGGAIGAAAGAGLGALAGGTHGAIAGGLIGGAVGALAGVATAQPQSRPAASPGGQYNY